MTPWFYWLAGLLTGAYVAWRLAPTRPSAASASPLPALVQEFRAALAEAKDEARAETAHAHGIALADAYHRGIKDTLKQAGGKAG